MIERLRGLRPSSAWVIAILAVVLAGAGTAVAAQMIGSKEIKNNSIQSKDVKNNTLKTKDLSKKARKELKGRRGKPGADGATGPQGPAGAMGATGPAGAPGTTGMPTFSNPQWGVIDRNTIGSPDQDLRGGPFVTGPNGSPPFGDGSLSLVVNGVPRVANNSDSEAAAFGNEVDFVGNEVSGISELGFHVFTTGENNAKGNPNMPNIRFEIDPNLATTPSNFSTLVYQPANTTANQWSGYIDATAPGEDFSLTGAAGTATGCNLASPCDLDEVQAALDDGGETAKIGSLFVGKGRDFAFAGAVDGLRLNDTVYDFEPFGVEEVDATP